MVIIFILISPLAITSVVIIANLIGAGIKDLSAFLNKTKKEEETKLPTEPYPESDVVRYINELKKEKELSQQ
jgi:hypothetical protein